MVGALMPATLRRSGGWLRWIVRCTAARSRRQFKRIRHDPVSIGAVVAKANAYFIIFVVAGLINAATLLILATLNGGRVPFATWIWFSPVLLLELIWLVRDEHAKSLLTEHQRLRSLRLRGSKASSE